MVKKFKGLILIAFLFLFLNTNLMAQSEGGNTSTSGQNTASGTSAASSDSSGQGTSTSSGNGESSSGENSGDSSGDGSGDTSKTENNSKNQQVVIITGEGAISAAQEGKNLGNVSSEALKAGIEACGDDPSKSNAKAIMTAELSRRENIDGLVSAAESAESELSAAVKAYIEARDALEKLNNIPEGSTIEEQKEHGQKLAEATTELYKAKKEVEKKEAEARLAYQNLYEAYNQAGDPVDISSGKFIAEYNDYESFSNLVPFKIRRCLKSNGKIESFGKNWSCSLDSRIIRTRAKSLQSAIDEFTADLKTHEKGLKDLKELRNKYNNIDDPLADEWLDNYQKIIALEKEYIKEFEGQEALSKCIDVFNKNVLYGMFDTLDNRVYDNGPIIYLDDDGNQYLFEFNGQYYQSCSDYITFKIYPCETTISRSSNLHNLLFDNNQIFANLLKDYIHSFRIEFEDGSKRYYSSYGILLKDCDRFGNEIIYETGNSGRIETIDLPGSEEINISRNSSGLITSIKNNIGDEITYTYDNSNLSGIYYNKKLYQSYSYDNGGYLVNISKSDGTCVKIDYDYVAWLGKRCIKVTDENDNSETSTYSRDGTVHNTVNGASEIYRYNSAGNTIYKKDSLGREHIFSNYQDGRIEKVKIGDKSKEYVYDSKGRVILIRFENGGEETFSYNSAGFLTKYTDADGFSREYKYDSRNNLVGIYFNGILITSCNYNSKGLLTGLEEAGNSYTYYYDDFFWKVNKIVWRNSNGEVKTQSIEYDSKGRISCLCDFDGNVFDFSYRENYKCVTGSRKKTETYYDDYQNVMKVVESDLVNDFTYTKSYVRDNKGNVIKLYLDGNLYCEYEYDPSNQVKSKVVWNNLGDGEYCTGRQGIRSEYFYDSRSLLVGVKKSIVQSENEGKVNSLSGGEISEKNIVYCVDSSGMTVNEYYRGADKPYVFKYDNNSRLVSRLSPDGYKESYVYSKGGRLYQILDSNGNVSRFDYFPDGSYERVLRDSQSNTCKWSYDKNWNLISFEDFEANEYSYSYDWCGNLMEEIGPGWKVIYERDSKNRVLSERKYDSNGKLVFVRTNNYDDKNLTVKILENNKYESRCHYDVWGRLLWTEDRTGKCDFTYDVLGNQIERCDENGQVYNFEYTPGGKVAYIKSSGGEIIRQFFNAEEECVKRIKDDRILYEADYGKAGMIEKVVDEFGNESIFNYDSSLLVTSLEKNDTGRNSYIFDENRKTIGILENGNKLYEYQIGNKNNFISLKNPYGDVEEYSYDKNGNLKFQKYFSGLTKSLKYDLISNEVEIGYSNGEKIEIEYDFNQRITKLISGAAECDFTYDELGQMIKSKSSNYDLPLEYEYDEKGKCVRKKSDVFDYCYDYDNRGNVIKVFERISGAEIDFRYDERNREVERIYSNGIKIQQGYSNKNQKIWTVVFDKNGRVIDGDFVFYDAFGRVKLSSNSRGQVTRYTYDSKGRLIKCELPYSDDLRNFYYEEAFLCGLNIKNRELAGERIQLSSEEWKNLNSIIKDSPVNNEIRVALVQNFWVEKYEYTEKGSIKCSENQYGRINYSYDQMNRLISKTGGSKEKGLNLTWDKDCNLCDISSERIRVKLSYKEEGKMTSLFVGRLVDENNWKFDCVEFKYDGLGRPVEELSLNGMNYKYIYDGLSNEVIYKVAVTSNNVSLLKYSAEYQDFCNELGKSIEAVDDLSSGNYRDFSGESLQDMVRTVDLADFNSKNEFRQLENAGNSLGYEYKIAEEENESCPNCEMNLSKSILYLFGKPAFAINNVESKNSKKSLDCFYTNKLDQIVSVFNENGQCKELLNYDSWGNCISQSLYKYYSGAFCLNVLGFEIYRFGSRVYIPTLCTFSSMDLVKDGANWFAYCPTDPINYKDVSGFYKFGTSDVQNIKYAESLLDFLSFSSHDQQRDGVENNIPLNYDCADTTAAIDNMCAREAGMSNYSEMADNFDKHFNGGEKNAAKADTCSKSYYNPSKDEKGKTAIKTSGNREDLTNPEIVTPGTVLVLTPSNYGNFPDCEYRNYTNSGHTIMVISREMDKDGNIIGLVYVEGHTSPKTPAEMSYMYVNDQNQCWKGLYNFDQWAGHYDGTYEIESDAHAAKGKPGSICTTR